MPLMSDFNMRTLGNLIMNSILSGSILSGTDAAGTATFVLDTRVTSADGPFVLILKSSTSGEQRKVSINITDTAITIRPAPGYPS